MNDAGSLNKIDGSPIIRGNEGKYRSGKQYGSFDDQYPGFSQNFCIMMFFEKDWGFTIQYLNE